MRILAMGGGGFLMEPWNPLLDDHVLALTGKDRPRIALLATAMGDSDRYITAFHEAFDRKAEATHVPLFRRRDDLRGQILSQDAIYVGGGNTVNLLAIWRIHGVDALLREAWERGVVLAGVSAGAVCWFEGMVTDSFGPELSGVRDGLGLLPGTFCPHYDGEARRRPRYHELVAGGFPAGHAADDGAAFSFAGTTLEEIVSSRPGARAFRVERGAEGVVETELPVRFLGRR